MKWGFFLFILFVSLGCSNNSRAPQSNISSEIHVVLDIDWTIVLNFDEKISQANPAQIIEIQNKKYIKRTGLIEFIEFLQSKDIRISFFSGGTKSRNEELLNTIKLANGESLLDIAYKVKNAEDLTRMDDVPDTAKFSEKFKKDITKINTELYNIVLIDDNKHFALNELQKKNLIHLGPTYNYFETYAEALNNPGEYSPKTLGEWEFDRQKLSIIKKQIEESLDLMRGNKALSFMEAMNLVGQKIDLNSGNWNKYTQELKLNKKIKINSNGNCSNDILIFLN